MQEVKRVLFNSVPKGMPVMGETMRLTTTSMDLSNVPLHKGVLTKTLYLSLDPYMRGRMRAPELKSYRPPFALNEPIWSFALSKVVRSEDATLKPDDLVFGLLPWEEYSVLHPDTVKTLTVIKNEQKLPLSNWVGAAGRTGLTAYASFYHIGKPKKGEKIYISAASGAVGQLVGQLAKREGLFVIGSAGSDQKVDLLRNELGFDSAFNYKTCNVLEELRKHEPIQIYYDNVGGEQLDAFLLVGDTGARIVACGMISQYNTTEPYGLKNMFQIVAKTMTMTGFLTTTLGPAYLEAFHRDMPKWLASGEIKSIEHITDGLEKAPEAFIGMLQGQNVGKAIVRVADA